MVGHDPGVVHGRGHVCKPVRQDKRIHLNLDAFSGPGLLRHDPDIRDRHEGAGLISTTGKGRQGGEQQQAGK